MGAFFDQVDYESEEEQEDNGSDKENAEDRQEKAESSELLEEESKDKIYSQDGDMRINSVLSLSSTIEDYRYDTEDGLWCEVCF